MDGGKMMHGGKEPRYMSQASDCHETREQLTSTLFGSEEATEASKNSRKEAISMKPHTIQENREDVVTNTLRMKHADANCNQNKTACSIGTNKEEFSISVISRREQQTLTKREHPPTIEDISSKMSKGKRQEGWNQATVRHNLRLMMNKSASDTDLYRFVFKLCVCLDKSPVCLITV